MEKQKILNVLKFYYRTSKLKEMERSGWQKWNISRNGRVESVPEHIYGSQQLAIAIYSEFKPKVDIFKVITMLSIHETEEIIIGDTTPLDNISEAEKKAKGIEAVAKIFEPLTKRAKFVRLIDEFNERKTKNAKFAYLCDKLECDLQAKKYSDEGRISIERAPEEVLQDDGVVFLREKGAKTVADIFLMYDEPKYVQSKAFLDMVRFLRKYSIL